jgi:hypothetical protein
VAQTCAAYPYPLSNGTTADANQVMGNFNCAALKGNGIFTGNVGISTTTPYALLDLGTSYNTLKISLYDVGGGNVYGIGVNAGELTFGAGIASVTATPQMVLAAPGYLGVGTTSPGQALYVVGTAGGNNQWSVTSDSRLKKNVREITGALALVERIRGVRYEWRTPGERQIGKTLTLPVGQPQVGFVAQELETVMPEAVNIPQKPSEQPYSIKEGDLVPVLVEAVKEQQAEIEQLRAELAAMKPAR